MHCNTTATIYLPSKEIKNITESNKQITNANEMSIAGIENGRVKIKIGSGKFYFTVINPLF